MPFLGVQIFQDAERHDVRKQAYAGKNNPAQIAAFGNGNNDALLLKTVKTAGGLAVAVDNGEGCSVECMQNLRRWHRERIRFVGRTDGGARLHCVDKTYLERPCIIGLLLVLGLRLRPTLIRAARVLPSTPPLFHNVERHFFDGQFGGFSVSGIHRCPHTSHTATLTVFHPMPPLYSILS